MYILLKDGLKNKKSQIKAAMGKCQGSILKSHMLFFYTLTA